MSSSPASTVLATPTYSRSGRERKTVQKYGSMIDSDIISDREDEAYGYYDHDDEDESFEEARVRESDDEDEDGDGDGEEGDDEMIVSKPTKSSKQSQPKKKIPGTSQTSSSKPKPAGVLLPKSAKTLAARKGSSEPSSTSSKASIAIKQTQTKTSKTPSKRVPSPVASDDEAGPEEQNEAEEDSPNASPEPPSKKSKTTSTKPLPLASKPLHISSPSTASTKAVAKSAPRPKGVGILLAKKESTTSAGSLKAAARGATNKGFVPLKKVEVAPAATTKGGKKGVVLVKKGATADSAESTKKAKIEEDDQEEEQEDNGEEEAEAGDNVVEDGAEEQDENMSDGNEWEDDEKVSGKKKVKSITKASAASKARGTGKTPKSPSTSPDDEVAKRAPAQDMEEHGEVGHKLGGQKKEEEAEETEVVTCGVDTTMSASQPDSQGITGKPTSPDSPASTPKRKSSNTSTNTSSSRKSSSPRKLAPAEKIPASARVAIIQALCSPIYLKTIPFGSISQALSFQGEDMPSAKLSRHWREVLSADLKEYFRDGKAVTSPTKSASASGSGKQKVGIKARKAIWKGVVDGYEKANWKEIEEESGISTTKLKRHLRDVMRKEVEKVIGACDWRLR